MNHNPTTQDPNTLDLNTQVYCWFCLEKATHQALYRKTSGEYIVSRPECQAHLPPVGKTGPITDIVVVEHLVI